MDPYEQTRQAQRDWARSRGIQFDSRGYVRSIGDNLWRPLTSHARQAFEMGAGKELNSHMRVLHLSSALVANLFDHWTDRDLNPLLAALGIDYLGGETLEFEVQFDTGLLGNPPHLDVAVRRRANFVFAVESKFTEHMKRATRDKSEFRSSYFPESRQLWTEKGLPACQALGQELWEEELRGGRQQFEYLDPWQLLKHALGLATQLGSTFSLYYLYYDCPGDRLEARRREVGLFEERVGREIGFRALTY